MQFMELERVETGQPRIAQFLSRPTETTEEGSDLRIKVEPVVSSSKADKRERTPSPSVGLEEVEINPENPTWTCPRCRAVLEGDEALDPDERYLAVLGLKQDHEDYHFALDLQGGKDHNGTSEGDQRTRKKVKRKKAASGIAAYFQQPKKG